MRLHEPAPMPRYTPPAVHADDDPDESDLAGVPRTYRHACGRETRLSAADVRRYLRRPLKLDGLGGTVLCRCRADPRRPGGPGPVKAAECEWAETGQAVHTYFRRLIAEACLARPSLVWRPWVDPRLLVIAPAMAAGLAAVAAKAKLSFDTAALAVGGWLALCVLAAGLGYVGRVVALRGIVAEYRREEGEPGA